MTRRTAWAVLVAAGLVVAVVVVLGLVRPSTAPGVGPLLVDPLAGSAAPASTAASTTGPAPLPLRPDGYGEVLPTPPGLVDRELPTVDRLPPPVSGGYESTVATLTPEQVARSTWKPGCPVPPERLRYLTMSFRGFDGRAHTGDMIVRDDVAPAVVAVFGRLFATGFPIEEMRTITPGDLDALPTGVGNNTAAYACRTATGQTRFSAHAYGLAVDVDPFQNPLRRRDGLVIPELASAYTDRSDVRPGMLRDGDVVVRAFEGIGWTWGARFSAPIDTMHFSATGN